MQEGLKKIDLGEFNGFLRDFKLNLPRQKTNELFLKAGDNLKEIGRDHFRKAIVLVGQEYAHAKLRENKERRKEWDKLVADLQIPESYPNTEATEEAREKLLDTLNVKTERFVKYVDNNLRQRLLMVDQMPVARGAMVLKKKATTIAGAKLRLSAAAAEDLRKSKESSTKGAEKSEAKGSPAKDGQGNPVTDPEPGADSQPPKDDNDAAQSEPHSGVPSSSPSKKVSIQGGAKKDAIDPYLIKLDRMEVIKPPSEDRKEAMRKQLEELEKEVIEAEEKVRVR